ncbi:MAG: hypothetical protein HC772_08140 [Leptolyngbyaceae cyanobacterium CRU_2_3]|nr:hypothetical protein [Leptolyngbyaceae cyanobacterium CRU_2_3]
MGHGIGAFARRQLITHLRPHPLYLRYFVSELAILETIHPSFFTTR